MKMFTITVKQFQPWFLALHCQEVGGKNNEDSMRHVEDFVRMLMASEELMNYGQVRVYLDEDFTCTEKFTALGSLYFIHNNVKNVEIWDFKEHTFLPVEGKEVHSGNIERVTTKEKAKFPQEFFPECKWSRKGFIRTRWNINGTIFDLVNIHLFHDASNFVSVEAFPSAYTRKRQHALEYILKRFQTDEYDKVPFFIFGDFNFRLDTPSVIQTITNQATPIHIKSAKNGEIVKMLYRDPVNENKVVLTLEKKVFDLENHEETFLKNNGKWLRDFDKEPQTFENELYEFEISFPPSYPFMEDASGANCYMRTRCPSWCDRILFSKSAKSLVNMNHDENNQPQVRYQLVGSNVAMGDHKPVLLWFRLLPATEVAHRHFSSASSPHLLSCDSLNLTLPRISLTVPTSPDSATFTRYIHVKYPGSPVRIFRETTV
ncbi:type I inositol 1,4,5-trisphosphate 5-phosphatase-like isoform X2 [Centruroides sculpturatus]|uniref:type I inositol 1,4,5-trisphosphate 5-phosphatase-like isoform X2 n=1 Tax=Centruroides sculpturatus TaxID=218467 RepID=UPI000C6E95D6|nr:type I inositol 1,4,5-trisphosphate 5-phosphatase-like isoform X2 [Centruroides sculpturatus]